MNQFNKYAQFYDLLYKDKPYASEVSFIDSIIKENTEFDYSCKILDLACGTGKHLTELSKIGYTNLSGSDISSKMIEEALIRNSENNTNIKYYNFSFQECNKIENKYEVITSMFSTVNYIITLEDQLLSFSNMRNLLTPNGILIFDYWNGNAVARDYSPVKVLRKQTAGADKKIIRISETSLQKISQDATVKFTCLYSDMEGEWIEFEEIHNLHYYYFTEMKHLLYATGFDILFTCPFMKPTAKIDPHDWNITVVAKPSLK